MNLFSSEKFQQEQHLDLIDATISYFPSFLSTEEAEQYYQHFYNETDWQQDEIKIFGKTHKQPRLTALYGEEGKRYSYSNLTMHPKPFTAPLLDIKKRIEKKCDVRFNAVLLNLYRDGQDSNGWHSDDEKELGENPVIASVSLGANRMFQLRNKRDTSKRHAIVLTQGSLLLMKGKTQHFWQHQIPKTKKRVLPRINLTFRVIY